MINFKFVLLSHNEMILLSIKDFSAQYTCIYIQFYRFTGVIMSFADFVVAEHISDYIWSARTILLGMTQITKTENTLHHTYI